MFTVPIEVSSLAGRRYEPLDAMVDTGAVYPVIPRPILESLGVEVTERRPFTMADGREESFDLGDVLVRLDGRTHSVIAVFGNEGAHPLLGAVALETFGLTVDPINQKLVPVAGLLLGHLNDSQKLR